MGAEYPGDDAASMALAWSATGTSIRIFGTVEDWRRWMMKRARSNCSFCGKSEETVRKLIAGPDVFICDECVDLCNELIVEEIDEEGASPWWPWRRIDSPTTG